MQKLIIVAIFLFFAIPVVGPFLGLIIAVGLIFYILKTRWHPYIKPVKHVLHKRIDGFIVEPFKRGRITLANPDLDLKMISARQPLISFKREVENPGDELVFRAMAEGDFNGDFIGYDLPGENTERFYKAEQNGEPVYAYINGVDLKKMIAYYRVYFYHSGFEEATAKSAIQTNLIKTTDFYEDGGVVNSGDILYVRYDGDKEIFYAYNSSQDIVGEINKPDSEKIYERFAGCKQTICLVKEVEDTVENGAAEPSIIVLVYARDYEASK